MFYEEWCWFTENYILPTELRREALQLQKLVEYDDEGAEGWCLYLFVMFISQLKPLNNQRICDCRTGVSSHMDDEYKWAGVEDPKVLVTTSRDPSSRLKMFAKVSVRAANLAS